jgi:outer membrane receptor protein involved in Fe transport
MTVWEVGGKTAWLDGRLFVNGAAFYQDFTDKQIRTSEVIGGTAGPVVRNAGAAEVWGVEMDATWAATERLTLAGAFTWLDSEYTEFLTISSNGGDIAQTGCAHDDPNISGLTDQVDQLTGLPVQGACWTSRSGNDLERAPPWTASAVINYTAPLRNTGIDWYVEWRTLYEDEQFANAENDIIVEARSVSDVWLGLQADRWDAQLYVRNVFDDDKMPSAGQTGPDLPNTEFRLAMRTDFPPTVLASPKIPSATFANLPNPRQAGIQFRYRFGIR